MVFAGMVTADMVPLMDERVNPAASEAFLPPPNGGSTEQSSGWSPTFIPAKDVVLEWVHVNVASAWVKIEISFVVTVVEDTLVEVEEDVVVAVRPSTCTVIKRRPVRTLVCNSAAGMVVRSRFRRTPVDVSLMATGADGAAVVVAVMGLRVVAMLTAAVLLFNELVVIGAVVVVATVVAVVVPFDDVVAWRSVISS